MNRSINQLKLSFSVLRGEQKILLGFLQTNFGVYICMYIQNYLINRYMPSDELGLYSYYQSVLILFSGVYSMEVYSSYLRFVDFQSDRSLLKINRTILALASAAFILTAIIFLKSWYFVLFAGYMWMRERIYFFRAKLDIKTYGKIKIYQYVLSTLCVVLLIVTKRMSCNLLLLSIGLSYCLVALIYHFNSPAETITDSQNARGLPPAKVKEVLQISAPLALNAIVTWLLHAADQMLINQYIDLNALAQYSVALRNISIINLSVSIIMEYWPRFYFQNMESREFHKMRVMKRMFFSGIILLEAFMALGSGFIYRIMGASQYAGTKWMFALLIIGNCFQTLASINMTFQTYMKNTSVYVVCLSVLSITKFIINYKFISQGGVIFVLLTTAACYFVYFLCSVYWGWFKERQYIRVSERNGQEEGL